MVFTVREAMLVWYQLSCEGQLHFQEAKPNPGFCAKSLVLLPSPYLTSLFLPSRFYRLSPNLRQQMAAKYS